MRAMSDYAVISASITKDLGLSQAPIAVALVDEVPADVAAFDGSVPGGCSFWELAATRAFATSAGDHSLCAIGVYTHNITGADEHVGAELGRVLQVMSEMTYVREEDVAAIPRLEREAKHVIYAPLASTPVAPDVVMLFAHSQQGLVLSEAVQQVERQLTPALGRPACAIVPQVVNTGRAALSLGCCGARAYLDGLTDDVALWALPASQLDAYAERIAALAGANSTLATFHQLRRQDVEAGGRPTIDESLSRLS
jgi:uncharacterized protein (DUF169 family)